MWAHVGVPSADVVALILELGNAAFIGEAVAPARDDAEADLGLTLSLLG